MSFAKNQLLPGEKLIALTHQHSILLWKHIFFTIVVVAVTLALAITYKFYWVLLLCLIPAAWLSWAMLDRLKREFIITDRRIVKHEGIIAVSSFDAPLDKINNVFHEQTVLGRLLKYGTVGLETASEQGTTIFNYIPDPVIFKNYIVQQREAYQAEDRSKRISGPVENLPRLLEELASLRDRNIITALEFEAKKKALLEKL